MFLFHHYSRIFLLILFLGLNTACSTKKKTIPSITTPTPSVSPTPDLTPEDLPEERQNQELKRTQDQHPKANRDSSTDNASEKSEQIPLKKMTAPMPESNITQPKYGTDASAVLSKNQAEALMEDTRKLPTNSEVTRTPRDSEVLRNRQKTCTHQVRYTDMHTSISGKRIEPKDVRQKNEKFQTESQTEHDETASNEDGRDCTICSFLNILKKQKDLIIAQYLENNQKNDDPSSTPQHPHKWPITAKSILCKTSELRELHTSIDPISTQHKLIEKQPIDNQYHFLNQTLEPVSLTEYEETHALSSTPQHPHKWPITAKSTRCKTPKLRELHTSIDPISTQHKFIEKQPIDNQYHFLNQTLKPVPLTEHEETHAPSSTPQPSHEPWPKFAKNCSYEKLQVTYESIEEALCRGNFFEASDLLVSLHEGTPKMSDLYLINIDRFNKFLSKKAFAFVNKKSSWCSHFCDLNNLRSMILNASDFYINLAKKGHSDDIPTLLGASLEYWIKVISHPEPFLQNLMLQIGLIKNDKSLALPTARNNLSNDESILKSKESIKEIIDTEIENTSHSDSEILKKIISILTLENSKNYSFQECTVSDFENTSSHYSNLELSSEKPFNMSESDDRSEESMLLDLMDQDSHSSWIDSPRQENYEKNSEEQNSYLSESRESLGGMSANSMRFELLSFNDQNTQLTEEENFDGDTSELGTFFKFDPFNDTPRKEAIKINKSNFDDLHYLPDQQFIEEWLKKKPDNQKEENDNTNQNTSEATDQNSGENENIEKNVNKIILRINQEKETWQSKIDANNFHDDEYIINALNKFEELIQRFESLANQDYLETEYYYNLIIKKLKENQAALIYDYNLPFPTNADD